MHYTRDMSGTCCQGAVDKVAGPKDLFQALYHHFLCLADRGLQLAPAATPARGGPASSPSVAAGQVDVEGERVLCIRAMAAVYSKHAGVIGELPSAATGLMTPTVQRGSVPCLLHTMLNDLTMS